MHTSFLWYWTIGIDLPISCFLFCVILNVISRSKKDPKVEKWAFFKVKVLSL